MAESLITNAGACVFDAYGTLFNVSAAAAHCQEDLGDNMAPLAEIWRDKQVSYSWLRGLMGEYVSFWQVTGEALDFALAKLDIDDPALRQKLMDLYFKLDAYPEVPDVLKTLKDNGIKTAILSNGSTDMLGSAVSNAGLGELLDDVISVDRLKMFKPHPSVYQSAVDSLGIEAGRIAFMSSNGWDAAGAATFGFKVLWVNRFDQPQERLPGEPTGVLKDLTQLPSALGL